MRGLVLLALALPSPALAHGGEVHGWELDPWVAAPLLLSALLFASGYARLRVRSDLGRAALRRSFGLFASGWTILAGSVLSPLHSAGERSFTMHMIEHELIMLPAALLLVAARPGAAFLWAFPQRARAALGAFAGAGKGLWRTLSDPVVATLIQAAVMWGWHAPGLFDRALDSRVWHIAQHLSFLVSALLFWWAMLHGHGRRSGTAAACLFATSMVGGALGALMTFSASPWYSGYAAMGMSPSGLSPIEDQQLAGLLMWIPGGIFHAVAALFFLYKWLKASEVGHALAAE